MPLALTRAISPAIVRCELTHLHRRPIDLVLARAQHDAYEARLREAGCQVDRLGAGEEMPDSVFIEDTAVVFDEVAIIGRSGAVSRRAEAEEVASVLRRYRALHSIEPPGTLDGGDVLVAGRRVFVGRSSRTNDAAVAQIRSLLTPYAYEIVPIDVHGCLHLKSAATVLADNLLLVNRTWLPADAFASFELELLDVHPDEPAASNARV